MKVYKLETLEDYKTLVKDLCSRDQPLFIYESEHILGCVLVCNNAVDSPDDVIDDLEKETADAEVLRDLITDEDEILFDYADEDEMGLIL